MGEGVHFYKIDGKYFIISAWYAGRMRMPAARADKIEGPYEINQAISIDEDFGLAQGNHLEEVWARQKPFVIKPGDPKNTGRLSLHQGGIVQTLLGEWWGFSMMDYNSLGRVTALSPITWHDGWPYFGLPGNLGRTPRTWVKPKTATAQPITVPYTRNDDFSGPALANVWQWNHVPVDSAWTLGGGALRLTALPATSLWDARNTLTQRSIGPRSSPITALDTSAMRDGDVAGLALFNRPYAWIGVERVDGKTRLVMYDEQTERTVRHEITGTRVYLRADCDFITERAKFSWSLDGKKYTPLGEPVTLVFQLGTFQGIRYSLFAFNTRGADGGIAAFESFEVLQPHPRGLLRPIPYDKHVTFASLDGERGLGVQDNDLAASTTAAFHVRDMKLGRVALEHRGRFLSIAADGSATLARKAAGEAESFQWIETPNGDLVLMSLATNRFLRVDPASQRIIADSPGPLPDGSDGVRFNWTTFAKASH
jgi:beta-xylosidase